MKTLQLMQIYGRFHPCYYEISLSLSHFMIHQLKQTTSECLFNHIYLRGEITIVLLKREKKIFVYQKALKLKFNTSF